MRTGRNGGWRRGRFMNVTDVFIKCDVNVWHLPEGRSGGCSCQSVRTLAFDAEKNSAAAVTDWRHEYVEPGASLSMSLNNTQNIGIA
ncbi:hypothetical protein ABVT39_019264 [Epinephelus coioides]